MADTLCRETAREGNERRRAGDAATLGVPVSALSGVGPAREALLGALGIRTIGDLLWLVPREYRRPLERRAIADLKAGDEAEIEATIAARRLSRRGWRRSRLTLAVEDGSGRLAVVFFNQGWRAEQIASKGRYSFSGKATEYGGALQMVNPHVEEVGEETQGPGSDVQSQGLVPVYPLTEGLPAWTLRSLVAEAVGRFAGGLPEILEEAILRERGWPSAAEAIRQVHAPSDEGQARRALERLKFEELYVLQGGVARARVRTLAAEAEALPLSEETHARILSAFPFSLTGAQARAVREIREDLARPRPMGRLLQGDVGSGKTAVAAYALLAAACSGRLGALMAPTEILAAQHARSLARFAAPLGIPVTLLTGSVRGGERREALGALGEGRGIAVGTHALVSAGTALSRLAVCVVDEQHKFGVEARARLLEKGRNPHLLLATATPIPRTLALTVYGDLDVTILDELPPGRAPVRTEWVRGRDLAGRFAALRREVEEGGRLFVVYPLVSPSDALGLRSAEEMFSSLRDGAFEGVPVGMVHGRLAPARKEEAVERFRAGGIRVLVATVVIEVGLDIPDATAIVIEHAERFGLAQLHQLRGRVGRGGRPGICVAVSDARSGAAAARLRAFASTTDGFRLAEEDLRIRGFGDLLGTRQAGFGALKAADPSRDRALLAAAREEALREAARDPAFVEARHRAWLERIRLACPWERDWASVG